MLKIENDDIIQNLDLDIESTKKVNYYLLM